jgi:hypothetical protein
MEEGEMKKLFAPLIALALLTSVGLAQELKANREVVLT